jgi:hypothetical protein
MATAATLPLMLTRPLALASIAGTTILVRHAAAWRPREGAGFARSRPAATIPGTVATVLAATAVPAGLALLAISRLDSEAGLLAPASLVLGAGLLLALLAVGLLVLGLRAYPRLAVDSERIMYQPDARLRYELPWTDLVRVDLAHLAPGRPPALVAVPPPGSTLAEDLARDGRWRMDMGALVIDDLDRMSERPLTELPLLAQTLAHYRAASGAGLR